MAVLDAHALTVLLSGARGDRGGTAHRRREHVWAAPNRTPRGVGQASIIAHAKARTPPMPVLLGGSAYFVSNGREGGYLSRLLGFGRLLGLRDDQLDRLGVPGGLTPASLSTTVRVASLASSQLPLAHARRLVNYIGAGAREYSLVRAPVVVMGAARLERATPSV